MQMEKSNMDAAPKYNTAYFSDIDFAPSSCTDEFEDIDDQVDGDNLHLFKQDKIYKLGELKIGFQTTGPIQDYTKIKEFCLDAGKLFEDENFMKGDEILPAECKDKNIVWKRPKDISDSAHFIISEGTREDVCQGQLGDCWFLAALANLTNNQELFERVVPPGQSFDENYCGIFRFRFWQYGKWVEVVVDDWLPTIDGYLIFLDSGNKNEFWSALLEKAYAKLYGSYKNIEGGLISDGLEDLCGGLSEVFNVSENIWPVLLDSAQFNSFLGCSISGKIIEEERYDGLIARHAYSIIAIESFTCTNGENVDLLKIRNPWGNAKEWKGNWSDNSSCWNLLPKDIKDQLLTKRNDGEFWMERKDFMESFFYVSICHLNPDYFVKSEAKTWHTNSFEGIWVKNLTAGGGPEHKKTFHNNPQYFFTVKGKAPNKYTVILSLMQQNKRRTLGDEKKVPIGLCLYYMESGNMLHCLDQDFFENNLPLDERFDMSRQMTWQLKLFPGYYCVIPCTKDENVFGRYYLRVFSEININMREIDDEIDYQKDQTSISNRKAALKVVDKTFPDLFEEISGKNKTVGSQEIRELLLKMCPKEKSLMGCFIRDKEMFSEEVCKNITTLWDADGSGKLNFNEFKELLTDIATLELTFDKFDADKTGTLNGTELKSMLYECGYKVNKKLLNAIMLRYEEDGNIPFDKFVVCAFKLKLLFEEYNARRTDRDDVIHLSRDDFLQICLYH